MEAGRGAERVDVHSPRCSRWPQRGRLTYGQAATPPWAAGHPSRALDGSTWTVVPSPNVGAKHNRIRAVSAVSPLDAWAVGDSQTGGSLIEHWDGTGWSVVEHPVPSGTHTFWGVSALAANDAWVSGYVNASTGIQPLVEHWDGAAWQQQAPAGDAASLADRRIRTSLVATSGPLEAPGPRRSR